MTRNKNLIFIVAYNHEKLIEKTISRIPDSVLSDSENELLIIDDASKDNTFFVTDEIRTRLAGKARITVLKNPVNQGYGGNQKLGYRYAIDHGFERVIMVHGDGQYAPELLDSFISTYESAPTLDAVFGTRMFSMQSARKGGMPLYKLAGNKILTKIQNMILKSSMSEFHSGYRSYATSLLKKIPFESNSNDFHFDTEIIIQLLAAKAQVKEIPIPTFYGDEICHVNGMSYAWNVLKASLHYRMYLLGFLYDRKFDLHTDTSYPHKPSPYSSHTVIVNSIPNNSKVLDIGCGKGFIAKQLINKGCIVDGIDIQSADQSMASFRNYYQIDLIKNLHAIKPVLEKNEYDVILMADVLEHLNEPDLLLDYIRSHHKVGSRTKVIASTGNVAFFIVRIMLAIGQFNYGVRGILDKTHVHLFTRKSFPHLFDQAGFTVKKMIGLPMPYTAVLGESSRFAKFLESFNAILLKWLQGFFSYQFLIESEPMPTVKQILNASIDHSEDLRTNEKKIVNFNNNS